MALDTNPAKWCRVGEVVGKVKIEIRPIGPSIYAQEAVQPCPGPVGIFISDTKVIPVPPPPAESWE